MSPGAASTPGSLLVPSAAVRGHQVQLWRPGAAMLHCRSLWRVQGVTFGSVHVGRGTWLETVPQSSEHQPRRRPGRKQGRPLRHGVDIATTVGLEVRTLSLRGLFTSLKTSWNLHGLWTYLGQVTPFFFLVSLFWNRNAYAVPFPAAHNFCFKDSQLERNLPHDNW